jgi:transcriptional regulator with XRE-family HTH domain
MDKSNDQPQDWANLAREVKDRRDRLGLTQPELSAACNGSPSPTIISRIEGAKQTDYKPQILIRLERALRWQPGSIDAILDGGPPTESRGTADAIGDPAASGGIDLDTYVPQTPVERALLAIYRSDRRAREVAEEQLQRQLRELSDKVDRLSGQKPERDNGGHSGERQLGA